jgi:hypothetical protein
VERIALIEIEERLRIGVMQRDERVRSLTFFIGGSEPARNTEEDGRLRVAFQSERRV